MGNFNLKTIRNNYKAILLDQPSTTCVYIFFCDISHALLSQCSNERENYSLVSDTSCFPNDKRTLCLAPI